MVMTMTRLYRDHCGGSRVRRIRYSTKMFKWCAQTILERKNAAQKGKWKMRSCFKDMPASITTVLIISINRLIYLFRAIKTDSCPWHCPSARRFPLRLLDSFLFPDIKIGDNNLTPNLLLTYTYAHVSWIHWKMRTEIWYWSSWNGSWGLIKAR